MKAISSLFLAILVLVVLTGYATSLKAWGRNVLTRYVTTFKQEGYTRLVTTTNGRKCTKTCTWSCCNCRRCRTQYKTVHRTYYRRVAKQKPIYYCAAGWRASGDECTIPICTGGCRNGGRCVSPERCQCNSGWQGPKCRTDKNECATNNGGCQHHCNNRPGSYNCFCDPGYNPVGSQCQDINECGGPNNCQQKCVNKPGTYSCACNVGYRLLNDSVSCSDIDECANSVCQYKCKNTAGSFFCSCPRGYLLTTNKRDCADHDECMTGHHACQQRCVNHPGGYSCACQMGFTLNKDNQSCSDIDECKLGVSGCADQCNNTIGNFHCLCRSGYVLNPDNKTCSDQDECKNGRHTCSQICGNTPGSYYCSCRPGYYLDSDLRTCKGYSCISISKPAKGYMNCTGQTMDSVCQFSCQPGYELVGSRLRTCLANGKWSGNRAFCEVKTCKKPPPPANGHVKIPCSTTYKGKCSFGCRAGFFLNGSRTVSCSADSEWVPIAGKCDAITVCHPNPCFHGGQCNPINSTAFWCNCTNTAYTGNKCHKGIFRKPKYPRLQQGNSFNITFEMSPPENQLTITPSASGLEFLPRNLVIYPVQMEEGKLYPANMTVTAHLPGMHLITYTLSGVASNLYETVLPDTVIVVDNETSCNGNLSSSLPEGCHQARLLKCPHDSFLYARSTEPWKQTQGQVSSKGVVTVLSANNRTLPLGVIGTTLDKSNLIHLSVSADNKFCKNHPSVDVQCLPSEIIASVFIQSLTASLPRWLRLIPSKTLSGFDTNDAITYVWSGLQLKDVLKGLGLSVNERSYYSALLYSSALTVELNKSSVSLPKYDGKGTHLVVTDLCSNSWPPNALIVFNPLSYKTLQAISLYEKLAVRGWKVTAMAVQFSKFSSLNYSVYTRKQEQELISGSLELFGRAEKTINGSHPISFLNVRLVGNAIFGVSDIDKVWEDSPTSWKAGIRGEVTANMTLFLLEQKVSVELRLDESSGLVQYRESLNHKSYKVTDTYELSLNGLSAKDPFELNVLGSFIESPSGKVSFHANSQLLPNSSAKELSGSSAIQLEFALSGVVKFGPLKFPNMSISITMVSEEFKTCSVQGNKVDVPGLIISATFNQPEMLGRFFTCLNSDSLQIFLPSYNRNSSKGVLDTSVALLGDSFKAKLNISNSSLNFKKEVNLFDNYRLSIHGSSQLQAWDSLALKVTGTFGKTDPNSHQNALEDTMKEIINDYTKVVVETTTQRLKVFESMRDKIKARIRNSHLTLVQAENKTHLAIEQYLRALKGERTAFKDVKKAEKILTNSSEELNQLKASLERLCSVIECPFICVSGTACNTCYEDLISKEQGVCPATCHNLRQERLPPRQETSTCHEEECDHSGGNFVSTISCTFEKVGKQVVKALIIMGGTAALSSIGVPPVGAYYVL